MKRLKLPPLSAKELAQLRTDAKNIREVANRKGTTLDTWEESREREAATNAFDLGCWLFYYSRRIYRPGPEGLMHRVDCARRIFESGIFNPGYQFFTIFDFGERQFDTIFEMGDSNQVIENLREVVRHEHSIKLAEAFRYFGWPLDIASRGSAQSASQQLQLV